MSTIHDDDTVPDDSRQKVLELTRWMLPVTAELNQPAKVPPNTTNTNWIASADWATTIINPSPKAK